MLSAPKAKGAKVSKANRQRIFERLSPRQSKRNRLFGFLTMAIRNHFFRAQLRYLDGTRIQTKARFFAVQHRSKSQNQQRFFLKHVIQVREAQWRISNTELESLRKRYTNNQWNENGPQRRRGGQGQRAYSNQQQKQI